MDRQNSAFQPIIFEPIMYRPTPPRVIPFAPQGFRGGASEPQRAEPSPSQDGGVGSQQVQQPAMNYVQPAQVPQTPVYQQQVQQPFVMGQPQPFIMQPQPFVMQPQQAPQSPIIVQQPQPVIVPQPQPVIIQQQAPSPQAPPQAPTPQAPSQAPAPQMTGFQRSYLGFVQILFLLMIAVAIFYLALPDGTQEMAMQVLGNMVSNFAGGAIQA